ncbi:speckle-type POZ protein B-like [Argiope bruennichi]|uniref:TD and POZ domain-containing protein 4 n=1 Tax=Argiope bruennichi TaxID=94029 RepID=A0A8T0FDK9_ARGBR|nr:speckle-type POZ protein B-like [Argiope bruennichi]KAF8788338.1 TD and POZ domain-containing protein 4 [Argiope bruennichi]
MSKFAISWQVCSEDRSYDEKTRCCYWKYELNAEWKMKCVCEQNKLRNPAFIEIHRKSPAGECIVSGALEIHDERKGQCLLKKKFICLLEDRCLFARIDLLYPPEAAKTAPKMFLITGEMTVSSRTEDSMDLAELVHLTNTNYSCLRQLSNDMERSLLEKPFLADVTLKCGPVSIPAHKNVLAARSPVFKAMFLCPMKESKENEVIIQDIEVPVLQAMLKYMYTGKVEDLAPSLASDLLFAANKYQIGCLESACSKYLMRNMSMKNVASILLIGDFVSPDMKNFAIDFICNKCTDFSALEKAKDWIALKKNKPALALEIFSSIVKCQEQKLKML